ETSTSAKSRGFGIRTRLFLAFGAVAALTVLASVIAFLSYNRVGDTLAAITERNMPAMSLALTLARESAEISATAPTLAAATDKLGPLVDDANFNLTLGLQSATDKLSDVKEIGKSLSRLADTDLAQLQAIAAVQAETNLAQGLLTEASITPGKEYLAPIKEQF